jgi:hypothetical protein
MVGDTNAHSGCQYIEEFQQESNGEKGTVEDMQCFSFPVSQIVAARDMDACKIGLHCLMQLLRMKSSGSQNIKATEFLWDLFLVSKVRRVRASTFTFTELFLACVQTRELALAYLF